MDLTLRGAAISSDKDGYLCLTDMWRVSGEHKSKTPPHWRELPTTKELIAALHSNIRFSDVWPETTSQSAIYSKAGNRGGTFAHVILALAYAEYLSPQLGIEVREIALRVYAGDITVLDDYNRARRAQLEDDHNRIVTRGEIRRNNYDLNTVLKEIGARNSTQWAAFHNHGYEGLYDGLDENDIHARKELEANQAILDHMGFDELAANMFRTSMAQQHLRKYPVETVMRACEVHKKMGKSVRGQLQSHGLDMPEDLPVTDSIKDAEKRLRDHQKSLK